MYYLLLKKNKKKIQFNYFHQLQINRLILQIKKSICGIKTQKKLKILNKLWKINKNRIKKKCNCIQVFMNIKKIKLSIKILVQIIIIIKI